jgi:hypothetical protein
MKAERLKNLSIILSSIGFNDHSIMVRELLKFSADQVATNRAISSDIPEGHFTEEDVSPERYKEKIKVLFRRDVYIRHFDRYKKLYMKEGLSEEEAIKKANEKVDEISAHSAEKAVSGHTAATSLLEEYGSEPGDLIISPGSGVGHEQVVAPQYKWRGLEYQSPQVNMANQRNMQMGLIDSNSKEWSLLNVDVNEELGDDWTEKLNSIIGEEGLPKVVYAKHACGGLTDGVMFDAANKGVKKMLFATCCANRYAELSWRVLSPKDESGKPLSFEEYNKIAKSSKKDGEEGKMAVDMIDGWREDFLKSRGYEVTRGRRGFGPYILAKKQ